MRFISNTIIINNKTMSITRQYIYSKQLIETAFGAESNKKLGDEEKEEEK